MSILKRVERLNGTGWKHENTHDVGHSREYERRDEPTFWGTVICERGKRFIMGRITKGFKSQRVNGGCHQIGVKMLYSRHVWYEQWISCEDWMNSMSMLENRITFFVVERSLCSGIKVVVDACSTWVRFIYDDGGATTDMGILILLRRHDNLYWLQQKRESGAFLLLHDWRSVFWLEMMSMNLNVVFWTALSRYDFRLVQSESKHVTNAQLYQPIRVGLECMCFIDIQMKDAIEWEVTQARLRCGTHRKCMHRW